MKKLFLLLLVLVAFLGCNVEAEGDELSVEEKLEQELHSTNIQMEGLERDIKWLEERIEELETEPYAIINSRIYKFDREEFTSDFDIVGEECLEMYDREDPWSSYADAKGFRSMKLFDGNRYLMANYYTCMCEGHCGWPTAYVFDLQSGEYFTHDVVSEEISKFDPEVGKMVLECSDTDISELGTCYWYQIKDISEGVLTLNIFENGDYPGDYVYHCMWWLHSDFDSPIDEVERVCGFDFVKELEIKSFSGLF